MVFKKSFIITLLILSLGLVYAGLDDTSNTDGTVIASTSSYNSEDVSQMYNNLKIEFDNLKRKYEDLEKKHKALENNYNSLLKNYENLKLKTKTNIDKENISTKKKKSNTYLVPYEFIKKPSIKRGQGFVNIEYSYGIEGYPQETVFEYWNVNEPNKKYKFTTLGSVKLGDNYKYKVKAGTNYFLIYHNGEVIYNGSFFMPKNLTVNSNKKLENNKKVEFDMKQSVVCQNLDYNNCLKNKEVCKVEFKEVKSRFGKGVKRVFDKCVNK